MNHTPAPATASAEPVPGPPVHRCTARGCTRPIGDGDWAAGRRECVWCRAPRRPATGIVPSPRVPPGRTVPLPVLFRA